MADEVSEEQLKQLAIDEKDDESSKYKAPAEKSIAELQQLDADDEALRRYKESLLGTLWRPNSEFWKCNFLVRSTQISQQVSFHLLFAANFLSYSAEAHQVAFLSQENEQN